MYKYVYTIINKLTIGILQGQIWFVITAHLTGRNNSLHNAEYILRSGNFSCLHGVCSLV